MATTRNTARPDLRSEIGSGLLSSDLDTTLAALADPVRRGAIDLLREGPRGAGELAAALSQSPPSMSRHLKVLRDVGLVRADNPAFDARVRVYSLNPRPLADLARWLGAAEELWAEQLTRLKEHVEGT